MVPPSIRESYVRPDTFHLFVPPAEDYESDEENKRETKRRKIKDKYKKKTIKRVADKIKSETGQVTYKVIWEGSCPGEFEVRLFF